MTRIRTLTWDGQSILLDVDTIMDVSHSKRRHAVRIITRDRTLWLPVESEAHGEWLKERVWALFRDDEDDTGAATTDAGLRGGR